MTDMHVPEAYHHTGDVLDPVFLLYTAVVHVKITRSQIFT